MISLYDLVPTVYSSASRDFQYLSWLFNIVLNYVKHNVDDLYSLPKYNADSVLTELLAFTLGFKIKRNYDKDQLLALVSILPDLFKHKGTAYAIRLAGTALIKSSGASGECLIEQDDDAINNGIIKVVLPKDLIDVSLFTDILPYILPAGVSCLIVRKTVKTSGLETIIGYKNAIIAKAYKEYPDTTNLSNMSGLYDISGLFNADEQPKNPNFTNFTDVGTENVPSHVLNQGLLSNTVIPVLDEPISDYVVDDNDK